MAGYTRWLRPRRSRALPAKRFFGRRLRDAEGFSANAVIVIWSLHLMEITGGEPDVVGQDKKTGEYIFFDCLAQTPSGRVSLCYDDEGTYAEG